MTIREQLELTEKQILSPHATLSANTLGRAVWEESCDVRTDFQRDRDRILHSKSFRRLKRKTQAFVDPDNDHFRTRLTHTLEVSQIARTVAKALYLNEDLTEAIALGHDLGHTPFGHTGEKVLRTLSPTGFAHNEQSLRIVDVLEKNGEGLNLTKEVRDGILNHRLSTTPMTWEGKVVRYADKIAYISHDMDDSIRAGIITEEDIPSDVREILGHTVRERLNTLIHDLIFSSIKNDIISMSSEIEETTMYARKWLFENVYNRVQSKSLNDEICVIISALYNHYIKEMDNQSVCDTIANMTDQYAIEVYKDL